MSTELRLVRQAIAERWTVTLDGGEIVQAGIEAEGDLRTGMSCGAEVVSIADRMIRVRLAGKQQQALLTGDAPRLAPGQRVQVTVERAGWFDGAQHKLPQVRIASAETQRDPGDQAALMTVGDPADWPTALWDAVLDMAAGQPYPIPGGALTVRATPAMTVVDVDGTAAPGELTASAARALGRLIRLFDLQGMIIVDLPTVAGKAERLTLDAHIDASLAGEGYRSARRTAINGFGLVQIVMPRSGASLVERVQNDSLGHAVRRLLWLGERCVSHGTGNLLELRAPPAVLAAIAPASRDELARRSGRRVVTACAPSHRLDDLAATLLSD